MFYQYISVLKISTLYICVYMQDILLVTKTIKKIVNDTMIIVLS